MTMREWLKQRIKKLFENTESTITNVILLALFGGSATVDSGTDWSGVKFNENSSIFLFGCNAAKGENSIAQILANKTGANTYGYTSYSFFTNDRKLSNFERRPTNADITQKVPQSKEIWLVPNNGRPMKRLTNTK